MSTNTNESTTTHASLGFSLFARYWDTGPQGESFNNTKSQLQQAWEQSGKGSDPMWQAVASGFAAEVIAEYEASRANVATDPTLREDEIMRANDDPRDEVLGKRKFKLGNIAIIVFWNLRLQIVTIVDTKLDNKETTFHEHQLIISAARAILSLCNVTLEEQLAMEIDKSTIV